MNLCHPTERKEIIAGRLADGLKVNSTELANEFSVSEDAIRRDLRGLASEGRCRRVYGGALPLVTTTHPLAHRLNEASERKSFLARTAVRGISRDEVIFIDSGSTNHAIVSALPPGLDLTIVTNSVPIASALLDRLDIRLVIVGGMVDLAVGGCIDGAAVSELSNLTFDRCFLGACAVSNDGISSVDYTDAAFKRAFIARSRRTIVLATNEKLGSAAPYRVAALSDVDVVLVERDAPNELVAALERAGGTISRAARA